MWRMISTDRRSGDEFYNDEFYLPKCVSKSQVSNKTTVFWFMF